MNNNKIGKFISNLRKEKRLTQAELGEKLYVTDKAVSKWERGLSLPDITILNNLADILDTSVEEILKGEKNEELDIEKQIEKITNEIKKNQQTKIKKLIILIITSIMLSIYLIYRNTYFGYNIKELSYSPYITSDLQKAEKRNVSLGVSKQSFMIKNRDRSYSYKNLRSPIVIENEIKDYLKNLTYLICNDKLYYYNEEDNFSIIEYSVKNNILYTTVSYQIVDNDYCSYAPYQNNKK